MDSVADLERSVMDELEQGVFEQRTVIKFAVVGWLKHTAIAKYLAELTGHLEMELAVPGIVTAWCEHGLGGWAHITTSCIDFMEYRRQVQGTPVAFCTVAINSCKAYDLHTAAAMTAQHFELGPYSLRAYAVTLDEI